MSTKDEDDFEEIPADDTNEDDEDDDNDLFEEVGVEEPHSKNAASHREKQLSGLGMSNKELLGKNPRSENEKPKKVVEDEEDKDKSLEGSAVSKDKSKQQSQKTKAEKVGQKVEEEEAKNKTEEEDNAAGEVEDGEVEDGEVEDGEVEGDEENEEEESAEELPPTKSKSSPNDITQKNDSKEAEQPKNSVKIPVKEKKEVSADSLKKSPSTSAASGLKGPTPETTSNSKEAI